MVRQKPFLKVLTETGPLIALAVAIALLLGIVGPASAQFFNFGGQQRSAPRGGGGWFGGGWFGNDFFSPYRGGRPAEAPRRVYQDFSKAPPPEKRDTVPNRK